MRYFINIVLGIVLLFALIQGAFAYDVPPALKGAVITVTTKDGKQYSFKAEDHKVVPREDAVKSAPKLVKAAPALRRNRFRIMGGTGPTALEVTSGVGSAVVRSDNGAVGGFGYDYLITDRVSLGGQALTNKTYLFSLGYDL